MSRTRLAFARLAGSTMLCFGLALGPSPSGAASLALSCSEALERLSGEDPQASADALGQTTGTLAMLGNLLCFVEDPRCDCLHALSDGESSLRTQFTTALSAILSDCALSAPERSLSGVSQQAAFEVCVDEREPVSVTLSTIGALSGFAIEDRDPVANATQLLGDDAIDEEIRAIATFGLEPIPAGAQIDEATLEVTEEGVEGEPFALGVAVVDHIDSAGAYDAEIFAGYDLESPIGGAATPLVLSAGLPLGTKSIAVTAQVRNDLAADRATSQFRIRFDPGGTDGDRANDNLFLSVPTLRIRYLE